MPRSTDVLALAAPRSTWSLRRRWAVVAAGPLALAIFMVTVSMLGLNVGSAALQPRLPEPAHQASPGQPARQASTQGRPKQVLSPRAKQTGSQPVDPAAMPTRTQDSPKQASSHTPQRVDSPKASGPGVPSSGTAEEAPTGTTPSTPPTLIPRLEFVGRDGTTLTLGGNPYRFTGINIYMAASGGTPSSCGGELYPDVGVPLSQMPKGIVVRFWAFQNFFVSNGTFNWTNFDQVLAIAAAHGDKVIPVLANQYSYCDGTAKDLTWYQNGYQAVVQPGDVVPYREYVAATVGRFANNPTIAMWQLVNEAEAVNPDGGCNESAAVSALHAFSDDVGGLVHRRDPNHLVSLGTLAGYSGSGHQWCGAADGDYQTLMASPGVDVCDFHDYGSPADPMGTPFAPNLASAIQMCHVDNKPIMVAETGIYALSSAELPQRATQFKEKFLAQFQAGVIGELLWAWAVKPDYVVPAADPDYGVCPGDPSLALLGRF